MSHSQLQQLVQCLRDNPSSTRKEFEAIGFSKDFKEQDLQHAVKVIAKLGFMLDCIGKTPRQNLHIMLSGAYHGVS